MEQKYRPKRLENNLSNPRNPYLSDLKAGLDKTKSHYNNLKLGRGFRKGSLDDITDLIIICSVGIAFIGG